MLLLEKIILIITALMLLASLISYVIYFDTFDYLIQEDGWVENWTAILLGLSGITVILYLIKNNENYTAAAKILTTLTALGLLFASGEEISWGQRFLGIESGEYFSENNLQRETNIHNLKINGLELNTIVFTYGLSIVFSIYFLLFRPLYSSSAWFQKLIDALRIPIPYYIQIATFILLTIIILLLQHDKKWELWECIFAITMYWIIVSSYNNAYKKKSA